MITIQNLKYYILQLLHIIDMDFQLQGSEIVTSQKGLQTYQLKEDFPKQGSKRVTTHQSNQSFDSHQKTQIMRQTGQSNQTLLAPGKEKTLLQWNHIKGNDRAEMFNKESNEAYFEAEPQRSRRLSQIHTKKLSQNSQAYSVNQRASSLGSTQKSRKNGFNDDLFLVQNSQKQKKYEQKPTFLRQSDEQGSKMKSLANYYNLQNIVEKVDQGKSNQLSISSTNARSASLPLITGSETNKKLGFDELMKICARNTKRREVIEPTSYKIYNSKIKTLDLSKINYIQEQNVSSRKFRQQKESHQMKAWNQQKLYQVSKDQEVKQATQPKQYLNYSIPQNNLSSVTIEKPSEGVEEPQTINTIKMDRMGSMWELKGTINEQNQTQESPTRVEE